MQKLSFPNRITIELTNKCNVSCTFCPRQNVDMKIGNMDEALFKKIIDEAAEFLPVKLVIFFRGESLLHPQFLEFARYAKNKGLGPIQFATNAFELDRNIADRIIEDESIDFISFSLDTLDPDVYKQTRMYGDLKVSMRNVEYLSEKCKEAKNQGKTVPTLQVSTIEIDDYLNGQDEFIKYWKNKVDIVRVYYEHDDNGKFRNSLVQSDLEKKINIRKPCRKIFTDLLVFWNGDLALCNYDWRGGLKPLNLNTLSIREAWNSDLYEKIRCMHNRGVFDDSLMCKECGHWRIDYMDEGFLGKMYK